ncbi:MAG: zinc ribbon domain-containing protein [Verrucomicrobiales bacterium]|nr:zinc ribbon domain-containing protein [Verrucomicrobiales bacterium]
MKQCSYCGRDNIDDALNCRECGTEFEQPKVVPQPEEQKQQEPSSSARDSGAPFSEAKPVLKYDNILVSSRGIAEVHAKRVMIFVPTPEINRVTLKFGRSDHYPILTLSIGIALALVGIFGLTELFEAPRGFRYELGMIAFGLIGGSMIFDTLKKRYFFEVHKRKGVCRLVLSKNAQEKDIQDFCDKVRLTYKHEITDSSKLL